MKKSLLILSLLTTVALPVAAVVSCSTSGKSSKTSSTPWSNLSFATTITPNQGSSQVPTTGVQNQGSPKLARPGIGTLTQWPQHLGILSHTPAGIPWSTQTPAMPASVPWSTQTPATPAGIPWTTIPTTPAATIGVPWTTIPTTPAIETTPWTTIPKTGVITTTPWTTIPTTPAATIGVPWTTQTKPTIIAPKTTSPVMSPDDKTLTTFNVTTIRENPNIGFLADVDDTIREFRCYDNGLFKIKIETTLIGNGKYFASNAKADLEAFSIANSISIGPAITHLPKGIQILNSNSPASLGGPAGVQISESNQYGSADDNGIRNEASLVDHEYGHHETMWDFQNLLEGSLSETPVAGKVTMKEVAAAGLKAAGYDAIAKIVAGTDPTKSGKFGFMGGLDKDFPSAYGVTAGKHMVFDSSDYPFSSPEIITRMLNILSCRTDLDAEKLYTPGSAGKYPTVDQIIGQTVGHKTTVFEPPAAFVSDATIRHWSGDSVFGPGKDATRIDKLINFYEKEIFGLGKGNITLTGDPNKQSLSKIELTTFDMIPNLDTLEVIDSQGKVAASGKARKFNSRMGFKNELISDTWTTRFTKPVTEISLDVDLQIAGGYFQIIGKDANGNNVDITKLNIGQMKAKETSVFWNDKYGLTPDDDHFYVNFLS